VQSQFPTDCSGCHNTNAWLGATFDHSATLFPLTGSHRAVVCSDCHSDGVYKGKSTVCSSCHMADYTGAVNPNHIAAQFPTDCVSCHNTTAWQGAQFNHDGQFFPIYSGKHRGQWSNCSDCHQVSTDFRQFTCLSCHEHSQSSMNSTHRQVSTYAYNSADCLRCHPTGRSP
jgi:predicted CXXCH cytochrome family protein